MLLQQPCCSVVSRLIPLLSGIGYVLSYIVAGAKARGCWEEYVMHYCLVGNVSDISAGQQQLLVFNNSS